ncbi:MAG: orotidine-5'-phosphate decarboxylase, partial [Oscillospiraceae bacterium]|nr:orotidine-5'-phosphate decarboxylase [Oscillospiraceae bacterium]
MSFDILQDQIKAKKNPTAVILGAGLDDIPPHILKKHTARYGETLEAAAEAALEFHLGLIDAFADIIPAIARSFAVLAARGWGGMMVGEAVIAYAKGKDLFVIADGNREDIGGSAAAYSAAWLGETRVGETACPVFSADCITLSGYMGSDAVKPFLKDCAQQNKCAFVLAHTPNPSSKEFQDLVSGDRQVYTAMGDLIQRWGMD